jgi:ribosome-binding protein aMBF1 (putative translation factor)
MRCNGPMVERARRFQGLSREDVAHAAGVSVSVVERMERGRPVFDDSVMVVAAVLQISLHELMGDNQVIDH